MNLLPLLLFTFSQAFGALIEVPRLDLKEVKTRISKQFKDTLFESQEEVNTDANVAMSLVDALQNWADALEAQISMMRGEVLEVKTSNRKLVDEVLLLKAENGNLKARTELLEQKLASFQGEETLTTVQNDLKVMSSSFGDFIDHFNEFTLSVTVNFTGFNDSVRAMHDSQVKMEDFMKKAQNSLQAKVSDNQHRIAQITAETAALDANVQLLIYNASLAFSMDFDGLQGQVETFEIDIKQLKKSMERVNDKQNFLANETDTMRDQIVTSLEVIQHEVVASQQAAENSVKPLMEQINKTLTDTLGKMEMNVTKLNMANEDIKQDMFKMKTMVSGNVGGLQRQANMSMALQDQVMNMASMVNDLQGTFENTTTNFALSLHSLTEMASYNSSLLQRGFFGLERHFIETKRKLFETQLQIVSVNATLQTLGDLRSEVLAMGQAMANTTSIVSDRFEDVSVATTGLQDSLAQVWNVTSNLDDKMTKLASNHSFMSGIFKNGLEDVLLKHNDLKTSFENGTNKLVMLESGLAGLMNYTLGLDNVVSNLKINVTMLENVTSRIETKVKRSFELYEMQGKRVSENANIMKDNVTKLSLAANILEAELSRVASGHNNLKNAMGRHLSDAGNMEASVQKLMAESLRVNGDLDAMKFDIAGVKAEASGVNVFVSSMQKHIQELNNNMTMAHNDIKNLQEDISGLEEQFEDVEAEVQVMKLNMTTLATDIDVNEIQMKTMDTTVTNMKTNVMGLGNYINNINSDLGSMLTSFDAYAKKVNGDLAAMKSNLSEVADDISDMANDAEDTRKKMDSMDYVTTTMKADLTELTTKMYNMKTTAFEQGNEVSGLKSTVNAVQSNLESILKELAKNQAEENKQKVDIEGIKASMNNVKTTLTSLGSSVLKLKAQLESNNQMDQKMAFLYTNITTIKTQLTTIRETLSSIGPDMDIVHDDMSKFKTDVKTLSNRLTSLGNPARFSCAVTTDEIRTPGVITYSTCNVNTEAMMNTNTGHISIREAGDYFLSFTANMVSVNSQAIWCAIYKQSTGSDGWQVLGMINNYQRDAGTEDDRDSGSIQLIAPLEVGDQVWVEWRGYGDSFLYSNPYRLISFTGFLLQHQN